MTHFANLAIKVMAECILLLCKLNTYHGDLLRHTLD